MKPNVKEALHRHFTTEHDFVAGGASLLYNIVCLGFFYNLTACFFIWNGFLFYANTLKILILKL